MKKIYLECDCEFHKVEIEEFTIHKIPGSFISICIFEHKSMKTGKLYKKPKLLADVILNPKNSKHLKQIFKNE